MDTNPFPGMLRTMKAYFDRSTSCLTEEDSAFAPAEGMFTVAQQVAHVAQTVDWFLAGGFDPKGFDTDIASLDAAVRRVTSLREARTWLDRAVERAIAKVSECTPDDMEAPIADGSVLPGEPRALIVPGMVEHTAHHRGALTVYARLRGKTPPMPYG